LIHPCRHFFVHFSNQWRHVSQKSVLIRKSVANNSENSEILSEKPPRSLSRPSLCGLRDRTTANKKCMHGHFAVSQSRILA